MNAYPPISTRNSSLVIDIPKNQMGNADQAHEVEKAVLERFSYTAPTTSIPQIQENSKNQSCLEDRLLDKICIKVDVKTDCGFKDYLAPNERSPKNVKPHLDEMSPGLIVSTGTERSFSDLLLSSVDKCTGLVVRDVNPRVKAYVDFVILLLRISETREEFLELSDNPVEGQFDNRIALIESKLIESNVPNYMKKYYLEHISDFASIYFPVNHLPIFGENTETDFRSNDQFFAKLQQYARNGNIVATLGSINDLHFLENQKISVVDTSNVCDYIVLDLKGNGEFTPRVIWTSLGNKMKTTYYSYIHKELDSSDRAEFDRLLAILKDAKILDSTSLSNHLFDCYGHKCKDALNHISLGSYSTPALYRLKLYVDETIVETKEGGFGGFKEKFSFQK